ncbi:hypothetical protein CN559_27070 [Bacillus pseudomycoides]|nr:hypothetical protein CN559_27070 [Bacillus pseudomycoides]
MRKENSFGQFVKNQQSSIKISSQSHEELGALMKLTNQKYAHEIIDLLIHHYVENQLTPEQKNKFKSQKYRPQNFLLDFFFSLAAATSS